MATLGQELRALIVEQSRLLDATADAAERAAIRARRETLYEQLEDLVDRSWDASGPAYAEAVEALRQAAEAADAARRKLKRVDDALQIADKATRAIAKLISLV